MTNLDDLLGALQAAPLLPGAQCTGRHDLFDLTAPDSAGRLPAGTAQARRDAIAICDACPELINCRRWVESLPTTRRPHGVVAGMIVDRRRAREIA